MAFVKDFREVNVINTSDGSNTRGDYDTLDFVLDGCPEDGEGSFNGRLDQYVFVIDLANNEGRSSVDDVICAFHGLEKRVFIQKVRFHQMQILELVTEGFLDGVDLFRVFGVSNSAANTETTVHEELMGHVRSQEPRHSSNDDKGLSCS